MELNSKYETIKIDDRGIEELTFFARMPTQEERNDYRLKTNQIKVKGKSLKNEGQKYRLPFGKLLLVGVKAPELKLGKLINGFTLNGNPMSCDPETGVSTHANWKEQVCTLRSDLVEHIALAMYDGASVVVSEGDEEDTDPPRDSSSTAI